VFAAEASAVIQHLPSLQDEGATFFEAASAGNVAADLEGMEAEETGGGYRTCVHPPPPKGGVCYKWVLSPLNGILSTLDAFLGCWVAVLTGLGLGLVHPLEGAR
jgi:hypothetical protein